MIRLLLRRIGCDFKLSCVLYKGVLEKDLGTKFVAEIMCFSCRRYLLQLLDQVHKFPHVGKFMHLIPAPAIEPG